MSLAKLNPLRYRGYYYDNETGYYYLQSRYYDPELGRFISADGFEYLDTSNRLNANAYIYCWNCPTAFEDAEGTTPKLSIDKQTILNFLSSTASLKTDIATGLKKLYNDISSSFQSLKSAFCAPIEKIKFYYMNPGELTSEFLSSLFGKDIHIEYKMLKELRCGFVSLLQNAKELLKSSSDKNSNEEDGISTYSIGQSDSSCGTGWGSPLYAISVILTEIFVCFDLQELARRLKTSFTFDGLEDYKKQKQKIYSMGFDKGEIGIGEIIFSTIDDFAASLSKATEVLGNIISETLSHTISWFAYGVDMVSSCTGRYLSATGAFIMMYFDTCFAIIDVVIGGIVSSFTSPIGGLAVGLLTGVAYDVFVRDYFERIAYNWYLDGVLI